MSLRKASSDSLVGLFFGEESIEEVEEEQEVVEVEERSTLFTTTYEKTTYPQYKNEELKEQPVFAEVLTLDNDEGQVAVEKPPPDQPSILVTGFGMRNLDSLQHALQEEERRLHELYKSRGSSMEEGSSKFSSSSKVSETSVGSKISSVTETERPCIKTDLSTQKIQLQYLLGLEADIEEHVEEARPEEVTEDDFIYSTSKSTKAAQRYLRVHRIFDFFQLIIAHLLGAMPESPIDFILIYLNKCLCYRSGLGKPPLLYEQKHIEQLYKLMDRMNIGFIDTEQYDKAMATLCIGEYNKNPPKTPDGMVARDFFIQEALECETAIFDDLIRRRWIGQKPPSEPRTLDLISASVSGPYFIPSDLLIKMRSYQFDDVGGMEEEGEGTHGE